RRLPDQLDRPGPTPRIDHSRSRHHVVRTASGVRGGHRDCLRDPAGSGNLAALGPPLLEGFAGLGFAEGALVETEVHQELVGLADLAARWDAEDLHDLVAVEVGAQRVEFLLL